MSWGAGLWTCPNLMASSNEVLFSVLEDKADETQAFVRDELAQVEKWDATGVAVDQRMLDGRRPDRGFTISMGKKTIDGDLAKEMRRDNRSFTLPETELRRGDFALSPESLAELVKKQDVLKARFRRGSASVTFRILIDEDFLTLDKEKCICFMLGIMTKNQLHGDERLHVFMHGAFSEASPTPVISCLKGSKGLRDVTPNQDNFSFMQLLDGYTIACCFDGHGPNGHIVSTRTVKTMPHFLIQSEFYPHDMRSALTQAFLWTQKDLVAHAIDEGFDVQASGATAVCAVWKGDMVWTAHAGDSRCVIGYENTKALMHETHDHKPSNPEERERIDSSGGEVRSRTYPDGWTVHRIFVKGQDFPGLCMSRTLGDDSVKQHGVIAEPDVAEIKVDLSQNPFLLLSTDGVWEFLDSEFVVKAVSKKLTSDGPRVTIQKLHRESRKRWKKEEGDYCDDITSVFVRVK